MSLADRVTSAYVLRFGHPPALLARAPGRVNLIGEHTDYSDGFVLPMAIDRAIWIALAPRSDLRVVLHSLDFDTRADVDLARLEHADDGWPEYLRGVAWALQEADLPLRGWQGVMAGDVPIGSGLSSSAALELAVARAFQAVSAFKWEAAAVARLARRAENEWVGMNCGIMDQMISAAGVEGSALLIDCRSLATRQVPLPPESVVVVMDSMTRRGLVDSAYNECRAQCEAAARHFGVKALRDVEEAGFAARTAQLEGLTRRRARHVIGENARSLAAAAAMLAGDAEQLGILMNASHDSLRDDFEVSTDALNALVDSARRQPGCFGARLTGAGFGGCAIALVREDAVGDVVAAVTRDYEEATGQAATLYACQPAAGASVMSLA
ncbi:MAG: galactokinase [Anaerolineaceae bacterium]|nr:galactokinase [Anaerolineaceae bacterium]MDE0328135.1 galactokinase [Anaerolineaceae bacterium]